MNFLPLNAQNPLIFIGGGRGIFCFYWGPILALNSSGNDPNRWLKGVIMVCKNWLAKGWPNNM
jgi:hypothetical protein